MTGDSARDYFRPHQSGRPANSAQLKRPCHSPHPPFPRPSHVPFSFFSLIFFCCDFVLDFLFLSSFVVPLLFTLPACLPSIPFPPRCSPRRRSPVERPRLSWPLLPRPFHLFDTLFFGLCFPARRFDFYFFFFPISSTIRQVDDNGVLLLDFPGRQLHDGYYLNLAQERAFCSTPPSIVTHLALHRHKIRPGAFAISRSITSTLGRCATEALATPDRRPGWSSRMP